jgi:sulfatase maturation enzyme AslB (radical SAM superfamily)
VSLQSLRTSLNPSKPLYIAISLDGPLSVHEVIRGYGTFSRVIESIRMLADLGFNVSVNTVISRYLTLLSYEELRDFLNLPVNLGVKGVNFIKRESFSEENVNMNLVSKNL